MSKLDRYRDLLIKLLPRGKAWQFNFGSVNYKTVEAYAVELTRVDDAANRLLIEQNPLRVSQLLPEWEKDYGLPDSCSLADETFAQRKLNLITKILSQGGQSKAYFIDLFASQGITITIDEEDPSYVPMSIPGEITGDAPLYTWYVNIGESQIEWAEAEDSADDYVGYFLSSSSVACIIEKYKPAHTKAVYIYGA